MKKVLKIVACVLLALVVVVGAYVAYVFIAYHRIGDQTLTAEGRLDGAAPTDTDMTIVSWNVGFGAYEADYSFFMDEGTQSWAWSGERLDANLDAIARVLAEEDADLYYIQELDIGSTRTYQRDERIPLWAALPADRYAGAFCLNYESPFLMYPLTQPHGASRSGLMTFSACGMTSAARRELPVETGFMKIVDLDRCYSVCRVPVEGGGELVLYNFHLSAYTSDGNIATDQLDMLIQDMRGEAEKGNWCLAGGDFNKDLLGNSAEVFGVTGEYNWSQPIADGTFDDTGLRLIPPADNATPVPSCRYADAPYAPGQFVTVVDGFIVTDNIAVKACEVIDTGFAYSDHNPVRMTFELKSN